MKVRLYAGDMHISRKDEKLYVEIQKFDFSGNKNGENFLFLVQMFSSPMGYLASIMFRMPRQYFYGKSRDLNESMVGGKEVVISPMI